MSTPNRIQEDIKTAMKAKDSLALNALRALKSALTNAAIEKGGLGTELEEAEVLAVVRKQIKQRNDSVEQFEKGGLGTELEEAEVLAVVRKQIKQRNDSVEQFEKAGRAELAATEKAEIEILSRYLPAALSEAEIADMIEKAVVETGATGKADMGKVMKHVQALAEGRADGKLLSSLVMKRLS